MQPAGVLTLIAFGPVAIGLLFAFASLGTMRHGVDLPVMVYAFGLGAFVGLMLVGFSLIEAIARYRRTRAGTHDDRRDPPPPPPEFRRGGVPIGPRKPSPLVAHAQTPQSQDDRE